MQKRHPVILKSIDDFRTFLGREIAKSDWFTITQDQITAFAEVTGDKQWIHVDPERAKRQSPYGSTIAHGFLTLSLISHMFESAIQVDGSRMIINYGLNRVRFAAAVPANSRLRATFSVQSFKELADAREATFLVTVEREGSDKPCCIAEWVLRFYI
jgi:acyl dehydratase